MPLALFENIRRFFNLERDQRSSLSVQTISDEESFTKITTEAVFTSYVLFNLPVGPIS